jgi:Bacterial regulatory proteins, lacI family
MTSQQGGGRQPAGIRDVARLAGVSVASVSFALNGQPGVADDTRRRILAVAAQLGYRANPQAQALRRGRTTTYGLVIRNFSNPFFLEVLTAPPRPPETSDDLASLHRELAANVPLDVTVMAGTAADRNVELRVAPPFPLKRLPGA